MLRHLVGKNQKRVVEALERAKRSSKAVLIVQRRLLSSPSRPLRTFGRRLLIVSATTVSIAGIGVFALNKINERLQISLPGSGWLSRLQEIVSGGIDGLGKWTSASNEEKENTSQNSVSREKAPLAASPSMAPDSELKERLQAAQSELLDTQEKYQKELERLEAENKELRQLLMKAKGRSQKSSQLSETKSLIDMYSEVLDILSERDGNYIQDQLPRVVVVGDQSAGKTSVLEMLVQARIFPRGSGEMMTRSPVKVTLSEGPQHVAQFRNDSKTYDLTKESELKLLREEIEAQMRASVQPGQTVTNNTISLNVKGPGLNRVVLVDLPGVISTETAGMASQTKNSIIAMCKQHMANPNAIILCIQDGSVDAERSNVTDIVTSADPQGKRTIFVLTKIDLAEKNEMNPKRVKAILDGKLFPMKALGYFAVVTGTENPRDGVEAIRQYEEKFFQSSTLFKSGAFKATQIKMRNLSLAVSKRFWQTVKDSVQQQAEHFKSTRYDLESEWKNVYPKQRELDRNELFEKGRDEMLDQVASLLRVMPQEWDDAFAARLVDAMSSTVVDRIYMPAAAKATTSGHFKTQVDIKLRAWANEELPLLCSREGARALLEKFSKVVLESPAQSGLDASVQNLFDPLRKEIISQIEGRREWMTADKEGLRVIQLSSLRDETVPDQQSWLSAVKFMERVLGDEQLRSRETLRQLVGPGAWEKWINWQSQTSEQAKRAATRNELIRMIGTETDRSADLAQDELTVIRKNLHSQKVDVTDDFILDTWSHVYKDHFLEQAMLSAQQCRRAFYHRHLTPISNKLRCDDVVLFWRIQRMIQSTSNVLRQQVLSTEAWRLEKEVKQILETMDALKKREMIVGRRVDLAEELKRVRQIQDKLDAFIEALAKEK
ncbi:dynamin-like GTPase OPA1, mitochondrial [Oscarella lobularis]|uniref:dynamin-like GTPase OPA1, mitochondrial n=1 Tax=Oscarella lobularis TaxID=121494 RepID=UPI0033140555